MRGFFSGAILCIASFIGYLFIASPDSRPKQQVKWSEPKPFYIVPDTSDVWYFQAGVDEGSICMVMRHTRRDGRSLDFSQIFLIQKEPGGELDLQQISSVNYPSENPVMLRGHSNTLHFLWGERLKDPDFDEWNTSRPQILGISDAVVYSSYNGNIVTPPEPIFEGELRKPRGIGSIGPPRLIEDNRQQLHVVFRADTTFKTTNPDGEEVEGFFT